MIRITLNASGEYLKIMLQWLHTLCGSIHNENAFQWDAYRTFQWPSLLPRMPPPPPHHACPPIPNTRTAMHTPATHTLPLPSMPPFTMPTPLPHMPPLPCTPPFATQPPPPPPTVDRMIDACENITFPQLLLRTVKIRKDS